MLALQLTTRVRSRRGRSSIDIRGDCIDIRTLTPFPTLLLSTRRNPLSSSRSSPPSSTPRRLPRSTGFCHRSFSCSSVSLLLHPSSLLCPPLLELLLELDIVKIMLRSGSFADDVFLCLLFVENRCERALGVGVVGYFRGRGCVDGGCELVGLFCLWRGSGRRGLDLVLRNLFLRSLGLGLGLGLGFGLGLDLLWRCSCDGLAHGH